MACRRARPVAGLLFFFLARSRVTVDELKTRISEKKSQKCAACSVPKSSANEFRF
jgi:hypothetical protein